MHTKTLAAAALSTALFATAAPAGADTVTEWNLNASNALFGVAAQPPQQSVLHLAMVHGAVYDAVNAIDGRREGYLMSAGTASPCASREAAAATAAHDVLLSIVPAQKTTLDAQLATSLLVVSSLATAIRLRLGYLAAATGALVLSTSRRGAVSTLTLRVWSSTEFQVRVSAASPKEAL